LSKSVHRASGKRTRLARVLFACVTALVLFVFIAGGLNLRSRAQSDNSRRSDREASFNHKADRILRSPEMRTVLEYVATSPEVRRALTQQSSSLAGDMVGGVRTRSESLDDAAERRIRSWLRRPRPASG